MSEKVYKCMACGSTDVTVHREPMEVCAPYGVTEMIEDIYTDCHDCYESISITYNERVEIDQAYKRSCDSSIEPILEYLNDKTDYSMAAIERVLHLPARTLYRMKSEKEYSSAAIALLRMIRTFPWLLDVAAKDYDSEVAAKYGEK